MGEFRCRSAPKAGVDAEVSIALPFCWRGAAHFRPNRVLRTPDSRVNNTQFWVSRGHTCTLSLIVLCYVKSAKSTSLSTEGGYLGRRLAIDIGTLDVLTVLGCVAQSDP